MPLLLRVCQFILVACLMGTAALAEPVSINRGTGLGYVFNHRGNCYLIVPDHVRQGATRLSLSTSAPSSIGDAEIFRTYAPGMDLALGIVTSGLSQRCNDRFEALRTDLQPILDRIDTAQLVRVDAGGLELRDDMVITSFDFESITARPASSDLGAEIYQGSSGGILRSGSTIIGMAVQSQGIDDAFFLRADEIAARLGRLLDTGPATIVRDEAVPERTGEAGLCPAGSIAIAAVSCNIEPLSPELSCANLANGGVTAFPPTGTPPRIILDLAGETAIPLRMVALGSSASAPSATRPKGILIEISSNTAGAPRWRRFAGGDMPPTGRFEAPNGAAPYATQVAITLQSSWDSTLPTALDCLALD